MGGTKLARGARAKILLINIHYSLKPIDFIAQTSAESSTGFCRSLVAVKMTIRRGHAHLSSTTESRQKETLVCIE